MSIYLSVYLSIYLSVYLSIYLSIYLSVHNPFVCQVPKTAEKFRQLCTGEAGRSSAFGAPPLCYKGCAFHRIVPGQVHLILCTYYVYIILIRFGGEGVCFWWAMSIFIYVYTIRIHTYIYTYIYIGLTLPPSARHHSVIRAALSTELYRGRYTLYYVFTTSILFS